MRIFINAASKTILVLDLLPFFLIRDDQRLDTTPDLDFIADIAWIIWGMAHFLLLFLFCYLETIQEALKNKKSEEESFQIAPFLVVVFFVPPALSYLWNWVF